MTIARNHRWLFIVPVLLFAAWLGARGLNQDAIWLDEYYSIFESGGAHFGPLSPVDLAFRVASWSVWPPAYNFTLAGWSAFVGWSPPVARMLSWLLGLLSICVVYRLARQLYPQRWLFAFDAAVFMAGSAFYVYYFHELRGYTLHILLGCTAMSLYWSLFQGNRKRSVKSGFILALVLLLYSHPIGQLWFAMLFSFHTLFGWKNKQRNQIFLLFGISLVLYLPWIIIMLMRVSREIASPRGIDPLIILSASAAAYSNWLTLIIGGLCLLTLRYIQEKQIQFLWYWLIGVLVFALVVDRLVPFLFHIRLIMAVFPPILLLAARGLLEFNHNRYPSFAVLILWLMMGVALSHTPKFITGLPGALPPIAWNGFNATLKALEQYATQEDAILFHFADTSVEKWLNPSIEYYLYGSPLHFALLSLANQQDNQPLDGRLRDFIEGAPHVWVAVNPEVNTDQDALVLSGILSENYIHCQVFINTEEMHLDLYASEGTATCPQPISIVP